MNSPCQGMNSAAADGSVPADYQAVYDQLQEVKKRKNELTVNKGVDPNKWSQRMLREANEAQANAEAGLAPAPRWLTEQGISLAGNAPGDGSECDSGRRSGGRLDRDGRTGGRPALV